MIYIKDNIFHLSTENTSYIFRVTKYGDLENLYYGEKIAFQSDYTAFFQNRSLLLVSAMYPENDVSYGIDSMCFEYSTDGNGDMRKCACRAQSENTLCRFKYETYSTGNIENESPNQKAYNADDELTVILSDEITGASLILYYRIFNDCDCITRSVCLRAGNKEIELNRLSSLQLDLPREDLKAVTFNGAWGRERFKEETALSSGKFSIEANAGASSARHNPFIMLAQTNADNFSGEVYGFNLIYSSSHCQSVELSPYSNTRFLSSFGADDFSAFLECGEEFYTPEAVMTYSSQGYNGISANMHRFINSHITPKQWKGKSKPVLVNSWEAMYFNITEKKILELADKAKEIGAELLVVDDGWFGKRDDDTSSLGDWWVHKTKFPDGLRPTADKVREKGLLFGLWFEPEMISRNSELFREHPDWALGNQNRDPIILGRNQLVLDLTRREIQDYIIEIISQRITEIGIDYIKWDFNRLLSDTQSAKTPAALVMHRYVLGLYRVLKELTDRHPNVLFELCASGGTRFDLGMMCYMPVGWVSDNTDVMTRTLIQEGTSYAYPPDVMCNHISICPNHQTKRTTKLKDRYSAAAFGVLGIQYDLTVCSEQELAELKKYVSEYKQIRNILSGASFYRILDGFKGNYHSWLLVSEDKQTAFLYVMQKLFFPVNTLPRLHLTGLMPDEKYKISKINVCATGDVLMKSGVILPQNFQGNETSSQMSEFLDFSAEIYKIERIDI